MESIYFQSGEVSHGIKHYMVDTENDKLNLPRDGMLGNRCYVIATKKWYILDGSGEWVPFAAEGGSVDADAILSIIDGMSDSEKSQLRSELGVASVFTFKGTVEEESDLPSIANNAGDVYLVNETSSEYVWIITSRSGGIEFGRWEKLGSNVSGEPELFFVTFSNQGNIWSADKNITEINAAYNAGKTIVFKYGEYLQFAGKGYEDGSNYYKANIIIDKSTYSFAVADFVGVSVSIRDNITPSDIISVTNDMTDEQKSQTRDNLDISNSGLSDDVKQALLNCFNHVAWTDEHGQDYVDALEAAFYPSSGLIGIAALYTQSGPVYDTDSLDSLKADLVVTATYANGDVRTVTDYVLSGTLTEGTSTITVLYGGKTAFFDVTVTHETQEELWINQLAGSSGSSAKYSLAPFALQNTTYAYDYTKAITAIEARFASSATLSVGYYDKSPVSGETYDSSKFHIHETFSANSGVQKLTLAQPLMIPEGGVLAVTGSGSGFLYGDKTLLNGFVFNNGTTWTRQDKTLGLNVYRR